MYASVCLETQLKVQPKLGLDRSSTSVLNLLKPKKRKRSAVGGATSPEEAQELPQWILTTTTKAHPAPPSSYGALTTPLSSTCGAYLRFN
jgi:hypothetical protein